MTKKFSIISGHKQVIPFLADTQMAADAHRDSLGFFAKSVYEEFARRDNLYVLVENASNGQQHYAGHLLFERKFPRAKIIQMFTLEKYRRQGLATKLIKHLQESLTHEGFTSIYARVAEDLVEANAFWEQQEFYVQQIAEGGASRNRKILVRCHELASPQLFPTSGINADDPLGLATAPSNTIPLYLLDLNVLFDLSPRRLRHDEAASLFQAERMNFCRLAISSEIREELLRTASQGKTDPMEAFISVFPSFPLLNIKESNELVEKLTSIIFPAKEKLTENDKSDLRHVATAIQCGLAGLITNDQAILNAGPKIEKKFGIEILSPSAFTLDNSTPGISSHFETTDETTLSLLEVQRSDEPVIHALLTKLNLSGSAISTGWLPPEEHSRVSSRYAAWNNNNLIGYLTWSARDNTGNISVRIAIDETQPQALDAARIIFIYLFEQLSPDGPYQVRLELPPHQPYARELAVGFGFSRSSAQNALSKIILGGVVTKNTWGIYREKLAKKSKLKIPTSIPIYRNSNQHLKILTPDGNQTHVPLEKLETLLSPTLFCLPGRPAVITPVQRTFSEPLLGHSKQGSLLPHASASLFQERHYLSNPRTLKHFRRGTLILFYESTKHKGRGEIVAIARTRQAFLKPSDTFVDSDLTQSVLTATSLTNIGKSKMKTVAIFDNIYPLTNPVPLKTLQRIGCGKPTSLITTQPITDHQLQEILNEAFPS